MGLLVTDVIRVPVLTYHSQNVSGDDYTTNDHIALARDLETIAEVGRSIVSLRNVAEWRRGFLDADAVRNAVAITFDDGTNFDFENLEFPPHGEQIGFADILADHARRADVNVHATCFVIASPKARREMDQKCLFGRDQISDGWWRKADESGVFAIENHGWDHNHPAVSEVVQKDQQRGGFTAIDTAEECHPHVIRAAEYIGERTARRPMLFAYPFGESSRYLRNRYLPGRQAQHGLLAAFGTGGEAVTLAHDVWNLPRFVCGEHWRSPEQLRDILSDG